MADEGFLAQLQTAPALDLDDRDVYKVSGPVDLTALVALCKLEGFRELKEAPFEPQVIAPLASGNTDGVEAGLDALARALDREEAMDTM